MSILNKRHIKKGDFVKILSGDDRGRRGLVKEVFLQKNKALVEGINIVTKHTKPSAKNPDKGGIIKVEAPVNMSKLMLIDKTIDATTRTYRKLDDKGKLSRFSKKTNLHI